MLAPRHARHPASRVSVLSDEGVVDYLVRRRLVPAADAVSGTLTVKSISRRNHVFAITRESGDCYLLKQGIGKDRISTIRSEAAAYKTLARECGEFAGYLPHCYGYDAAKHVLAVQFVKDGENLWSYCTKHHRFPASIGAELGRALGVLHGTTKGRSRPAPRPSNRRRLPWVFSETRPDAKVLWASSAARIQLLELLQRFSQFRTHFDRLRREWKPESFIHFDTRWDNCIVVSRANGSNGPIGLKIVDWEMAQQGDPRWDVGAVFSNFLGFWVTSIPILGDCPPDRYLEAAEMPLERLQPAIRAFWESYKREMGIGEGASDEWLLRAVEYGACQLVQTAVEQAQEAPGLTGLAICLLQLCLNILRQPRKAAAELLGIAA
jgi:aminoglycoside phosphotransferase (APT) family kinase protein